MTQAPADPAPAPGPQPPAITAQKSEPVAPPSPPAPPPAPSLAPQGEKLVLETVPFLGTPARTTLANEYLPAADHKALAISTGPFGFVTGQPSDEAARSAALEVCQKRADAVQPPRKCEIYAVGDTVVFTHARPPMPPTPWVVRDPSIERPFVAGDMPLVRDPGKANLERNYAVARKSKALALGPGGQFFTYVNQDTPEDAERRALESCGFTAGVPCMVVGVDDVFVVPVPTTLKVVGFFQAAGNSSIAADAREDVARRLGASAGGWNAVAVGASGRPGLAFKASSEQDAVKDALGNCAKQDRDCHVIAIGPFTVGPN
jgi:adenylate cyclase